MHYSTKPPIDDEKVVKQNANQGSTATLAEVRICSPRHEHLFAVLPAPFQAKISEAQSIGA